MFEDAGTIISVQAWKGMLDGDCSMKSGWVHEVKLHQFATRDCEKFVVMGKVRNRN